MKIVIEKQTDQDKLTKKQAKLTKMTWKANKRWAERSKSAMTKANCDGHSFERKIDDCVALLSQRAITH